MKRYTKVLTLVFSGLLCLSITACGGFTEEDAAMVAQSELDYVFYNEASDEFLELCGSSKEEIDSLYKDGIDEGIEELLVTFGLGDSSIDENLKNSVYKYAEKLFRNVKFEVGTATKVDNYFTIPLTVYPIDMTVLLTDDAYNDIYASVEDQYIDGMTDDELYSIAIAAIFNYLSDAMEQADGITYAAPVTLEIKVVPVDEDSTKYYMINDADIDRISGAAVIYE